MRRILSFTLLLIAICSAAVAFSRSSPPPSSSTVPPEAMLAGSSRKPPVNGWTVVHLSGTPRQIGYQHGYVLAPDIADLHKVFLLEVTHDIGKDWNFLRDAAKNVMWPHIEQEYRDEMQ